MPQRNQSNAPNTKKKKKGRAPAHQNSFAFKHNPKSKKTDKILSSPNVGVCRRCWEKIEWRKKYRKYKPLTQPKKCNKCQRRNIKAAYHTLCNDCSFQDITVETPSDCTSKTPMTETKRIRLCSVCTKEPIMSKSKEEKMEEEMEELKVKLTQEVVSSSADDPHRRLTLREKKSIERKIQQNMQPDGKRERDNEDLHGSEGDEKEEDLDVLESNIQKELEKINIYDRDVHDSNNCSSDEEKDPFLKAIGGKEKMLVGEEYQKMLLLKHSLNSK